MRKPQKSNASGPRRLGVVGAGGFMACVLACVGALCLGGCSSDDLGTTGRQTIDELVAGITEVDEALDAFDVQPSETPATASEGLRHEVSCELTPATVDRVVDGDTIKVWLDGESVRVRLIGINAPESVAPEEERNTEEGVDASQFLKGYLQEGDDVWLMYDTESTDQYDRMLAYVWTEVPEDFTNPNEVRAKMLNAFLADQGYAVVHAYSPNDAYCDMLHGFADDAEAAGRGLWEISGDWAEEI